MYTAIHLLENRERVHTLLHDPAHFQYNAVNNRYMNLSDPVEMAKRIGTDKAKYMLLKDFINGRAPVFKAM